MKYKARDRVKIREDLEELKYYGGAFVEPLMADLRGTEQIIMQVDNNYYTMLGDKPSWSWTDEMIECKIEDKKSPKDLLRTGQIVITRNGERYLVLLSAETIYETKDILINEYDWLNLADYNLDLRIDNSSSKSDVMKIFKSHPIDVFLDDEFYPNSVIIWEREHERKDMTLAEIEEELGYKINLIKEKEK